MTAARLTLLTFATVLACSHAGSPIRRVGGVVFDCRPTDAEVLINDQYVGNVSDFSKRALSVPVGLVRVELRREGYFSSYHELHVVEGLRQRLNVELMRRPF